MKGISRLVDYTGRFLKENQFPFQVPIFFWWSMNRTQFLLNEGFVFID